jgi:hypothetical protein
MGTRVETKATDLLTSSANFLELLGSVVVGVDWHDKELKRRIVLKMRGIWNPL